MPERTANSPTMPAKKRRQSRRRESGERGAARAIDMGGLEEVIGYVIRRAQVAIFDDTEEMMDDVDISPVEFAVMRLIQRNPGINQISLATTLGAEGPRMVLIIDALEQRGLVARLSSTIDRRARALFLTPEGRALHTQLSRRVQQQNRRLAKRLAGDDPTALLRMLRNLAVPD
jgi:DNA-binding MarR family transcriptional regulator